jgi:hypothetical protein
METPYLVKSYHALIDSTTNTVLTISSNSAAINFLKECTSDTWWAKSVNFPNYTNPKSFLLAPFFLASVKPKNYSKWLWDEKKRLFLKTKRKSVDDNILSRSLLANSKKEAIQNIIVNINSAISNIRIGVDFQETVYLAKKNQAKAFRESGYDDNLIMDIPYVAHYADYASITLRQATDDILFKAKLDDDILAKTELLRLKYFNRVKKAATPEELSEILEEFMRDCYVNASV